MLKTVHHQPVVDFIGENDEIMLPGNLQHLLQHFGVIQNTGGVVGVDDDHSAGFCGDGRREDAERRMRGRARLHDCVSGEAWVRKL